METVAIYDFSSENENQMSFKSGEKIMIKSCKINWCLTESNLLVPRSYLAAATTTNSTLAPAASTSTLATTTTLASLNWLTLILIFFLLIVTIILVVSVSACIIIRCGIKNSRDLIQQSFQTFGNQIQQTKAKDTNFANNGIDSTKKKINTELSDECLEILKAENKSALIKHIKIKHMDTVENFQIVQSINEKN